MFWVALLLVQSAAASPQIERGQAIFLEPSKGCVACHALQGRGTDVGPGLKTIGGLSPRAIAIAIRSTLTQYVQVVKPKTGESFPAMPGADDGKTVQVYDLSKTPPELRKFEKPDIESMRANDVWKHPPAAARYSDEQMADLVAYIRFASHGDRKPVNPADVK